MSRVKGSKNKSSLATSEQIEIVKKEIEELNVKLKEKKEHLKSLEERLETEENVEILKAVKESGLTLSELLERIKAE